MSYAGLGARPRYASFGRLQADSFDRWRRRGSLGAAGPAAPSTMNTEMTFTLAETDPAMTASAAVSAVLAASATQRRSSIPAVRTFQAAYGHGLAVDGVYGPNTRAALVAVTGRSDLPAAGSSGGGSSSSYTTSTTTSADPSMVDPSASPSGRPAWLVPVAVVGALVLVAGGLMYRRRPVRANRRRRMSR